MITKCNLTKVACTVSKHNLERGNKTCLVGTKPPVRENGMCCNLSPASTEGIKEVYDWTGKVRRDDVGGGMPPDERTEMISGTWQQHQGHADGRMSQRDWVNSVKCNSSLSY
jgi:hypothetical protein